jgi:hypothetical protein
MQKTQPRLLVVWGKHDLSFDFGEPERYRKDMPGTEIHVLDAGHFALDTKADKIADLIGEFMRSWHSCAAFLGDLPATAAERCGWNGRKRGWPDKIGKKLGRPPSVAEAGLIAVHAD